MKPGGLFERAEHDPGGGQLIAPLDARHRGGVEHQRRVRSALVAALPDGVDEGLVDAIGGPEAAQLELGDVGAPPVLIALRGRDWHGAERVPRRLTAVAEPAVRVADSLLHRQRERRDRRRRRWGPGDHPTDPSMERARRRLSSTAYSIGSSLTKGSKK